MSDLVSALARAALNAMGAKHPVKLALAVSCGFVLSEVFNVLSIFYADALLLSAIAQVPVAGFVFLGVLLFFFPSFWKGNAVPDRSSEKISVIEKALEQGRLSEIDRRTAYRELIKIELDQHREAKEDSEEFEKLAQAVVENSRTQER